MNVEAGDRARARPSGWTVLVFGAASGLLGESIELLHIQAGGIAPPGLALRAALLVTYGLIGAALLIAAGLISRRRALPLAAVGFVLVALLPWVNFALLPRFDSLRSLLGNVTVVVLAVLAVPLLVRFRRSAVAAIVGLGLAVNVWPMLQADAGSSVRRGGQPAALPFNVVLVLIDTVRADHLGAYGYTRPTSPTFDTLARDSVVFEGTTAQAAWTKPSVASLMTGVYVHRHGVVSNRDALGEAQPSLAEEMRARGYRTAAFSANPWITPEFRFDRGFDEFESGRAMGAQLTSLYKLLRRVDRTLGARGVPANLSGWAFWGSSGNLGNAERDRLLTDSAVAWIESRRTDPYFLYVHLIGAHDPYDPPAEYARRFREPEWDGTVDRTIPPPRVQTVFDTADPLAEPERAALIAQYDGAIAYADAQLGRLVDALRRAGTLDDTLLVVTADHGEEFYEHRNWRHGNQLYNEIVHVPLLFRLPGRLPAGRRADLSMLVDVLPTIIGLVEGTPARKGLDGLALFAQTDGRPQRPIFAEHWWFEGGTYVSRMVRRGALKLQESRDEAGGQERSELYDLAGDPSEHRNLLENPSAVSENRMGELQGLLARFGDKVSVASAVTVDVDQSTRERLRQLGY